MPKYEGSYLVITNRSPTTYDIADPAKPDEVLGTYRSSALRAYELPVSRDSGTVAPPRRRSRPKKYSAESSPRRRTSQESVTALLFELATWRQLAEIASPSSGVVE
ncbi:hypothetical protein AVEN_77396-1 [Araneus ventricosus]|uniref:Uncharacterized protein n=1 Tax=Araneus ventricosus TaxID=182803 RepID=A0A4Y2CA02_ARAVE|nr:hypothetical protein AVEN_77396-1 [Araneus ventricosus]